MNKFLVYISAKRNNLRLKRLGIKLGWNVKIYCKPNSRLSIGKDSKIVGGKITIGGNACLVIGTSSSINGEIKVGDNCMVMIGDNFRLQDARLIVIEESTVEFGKDCLIETDHPAFESSMRVVRGNAKVGDNGTIRGLVTVIGGHFTLGSNSFLNHGSEVRCQDKITIGDYVYISYFVDIFDTNTHSTNWHQRREEVIAGYPNHTAFDTTKRYVDTAPICLGNDIWVGKGAAILKGSSIGDRSIVGTRAVVSRDAPEDSLLVGNPAQLRSQVKKDDTKLPLAEDQL